MAMRKGDSGVRRTDVAGVTQIGQDRRQVAPAGMARRMRQTRTTPRRPARGTGR